MGKLIRAYWCEFLFGETEAFIGQPRTAPPLWNDVEKMAWYAGYDSVADEAMAA